MQLRTTRVQPEEKPVEDSTEVIAAAAKVIATLRATKRQSQMIYVGARVIFLAHYVWQRSGSVSHGTHPDLLMGNRLNCLSFNEEFMKRFLAIHERASALRNLGGRFFRLDYFHVVCCQLALRLTLEQIRHGHVKAWSGKEEIIANRLASRLEAIRKQLKRRLVKVLGEEAFKAISVEWMEFARWVRTHFVYCKCKWRRPNRVYTMRKTYITQLTRWAKEELTDLGSPIPPDDELRAIVRRFVSYMRRGRTWYQIGYLLHDEIFAKSKLAYYVDTRRIGDSDRNEE